VVQGIRKATDNNVKLTKTLFGQIGLTHQRGEDHRTLTSNSDKKERKTRINYIVT